jgi:23S rRNA pseudouridine1911/1915/1917 synthase
MTNAPGEPTVITIELADRADKAVARHFPSAGRRQLSELFEDGCVKIKARVLRKGDRVVPGEVVELSRTPVSGEALRPVADPEAAARIAILVERTDLIVIDKPAGMPSQPLRAGELGTVANALAHRFPECAAIGDDPRDGGLAHRLDIGTSGVLVAARTDVTYRALRDAFGGGQVAKTYLAITEGRPVSRECDAPLLQRGKRVVVDQTDGLAAYTQFEVVSASDTHALVRCTAQTGRMHQVRAHLAHVGAPILGDTLYRAQASADEAFFLHAATIQIALAEPLATTAPLPARFTAELAARGLSASTSPQRI